MKNTGLRPNATIQSGIQHLTCVRKAEAWLFMPAGCLQDRISGSTRLHRVAMLHRSVLEVRARHARHDAAHVIHVGLILLHGNTNVTCTSEDDSPVARFLRASRPATRMTGLRHTLIDDAIKLLFDEKRVVPVKPNGVRQTATGCPKDAREGRGERINTMFTPFLTKSWCSDISQLEAMGSSAISNG
jgi:hypothetical protein